LKQHLNQSNYEGLTKSVEKRIKPNGKQTPGTPERGYHVHIHAWKLY